MIRNCFIKSSVVVGVFCIGLFSGIMLADNNDASALKKVLSHKAPAMSVQAWNDEQKEIWAVEKAVWEEEFNQDINGLASYFHPEFRGWRAPDSVPTDKASRMKWVKYFYDTTDYLVYDIYPVGVDVHGSVALVRYYYSVAYKDMAEAHKMEQGQFTDIWIKEDNKWLLIADHGGTTSAN